MKTRRFFSLFFSLLLALTLAVPAYAAEGDVGDWEVAAKGAILLDPDTGEVLYARNIHEKLYPASLTKVMTALLVLEAVDEGRLSLDTVLTASQAVLDNLPSDASNAGIKVGEEMTVDQLLHCILIVSACEACDVLAEGVSGSIDTFVELMNRRAQELGCENTHFTNSSGLHNVDHYTTAWDMSLIARQARTHELLTRICATKTFSVPPTNLSGERTYWTTNYLIDYHRNNGYLYDGANGMKTGRTSDAGNCLVATAEKGGRSLLCVVLGAQTVKLESGASQVQSFSETIRLFDYGFDSFQQRTILSTDELICEVPVTLSQEVNTVKVHPAAEVERLIPNDIDPTRDIERVITLTQESVEAPVARGQVLGQITLRYGNTVYATVDLLADEDVSASPILVFQRDAMEFIQRPVVKLSAIAVAALILLIIILRLVVRSRRRRYGRGYSGRSVGGYRGRRR